MTENNKVLVYNSKDTYTNTTINHTPRGSLPLGTRNGSATIVAFGQIEPSTWLQLWQLLDGLVHDTNLSSHRLAELPREYFAPGEYECIIAVRVQALRWSWKQWHIE